MQLRKKFQLYKLNLNEKQIEILFKILEDQTQKSKIKKK
jgi:hypothetical protein